MMKTIFLDTNVVLDLLGEREPYYQSSAQIATLADNKEISIVVSALTYATVFYLLSRFEPKDVAREKIRKFKILARTSDLTDSIVEKGLASDFTDFEDSLQYYAALSRNCDIIVTRNAKDFKKSAIPVLSPDEFLASSR